jgi:hypothetical protein
MDGSGVRTELLWASENPGGIDTAQGDLSELYG